MVQMCIRDRPFPARRDGPVDGSPAVVGERDPVGPPVVRIGHFDEQPVVDQVRDLAAHRRDVGVGAAGEIGDPLRSGCERKQHGVVGCLLYTSRCV